jgi:hypothetical protein
VQNATQQPQAIAPAPYHPFDTILPVRLRL